MRATNRGFTVIELLVVLAVIVLIVSLLLVAAGPMRAGAWRTKCMVNQRQLALACMAYSADHDGRLPSPRTDKQPPESGSGNVFNPWVNCSTSAGTLTAGGKELLGSLEQGVIWPYMDGNATAYRSPLDPTARIRSYSLNAFIGVGAISPNPMNRRCDELYSFGGRSFTVGRVPQPSKTMCTMCEEDAPGYNRHGWVISPLTAQWIDLPAFWDGNRINIAKLDGSTESLNILSPKLIKAMDAYGNYYQEPSPAPTWLVLKQYLLPGIVN
jgi:prepilin-type N-terminal cleavage/methylation domain-containing protein